ncbi:MAG: hypothetical protein WD513_01220 [Balneolaceae bacterium]
MTLINKIYRLNKIPQLLNKKRDARKESDKKKDKDNSEKPPFRFDHDDAFVKERQPESPKTSLSPKEKTQPTKEGVGNHIDVII